MMNETCRCKSVPIFIKHIACFMRSQKCIFEILFDLIRNMLQCPDSRTLYRNFNNAFVLPYACYERPIERSNVWPAISDLPDIQI